MASAKDRSIVLYLRGVRGTGHTKYVTSISWEPLHKASPSRQLCSGSRDGTVKV